MRALLLVLCVAVIGCARVQVKDETVIEHRNHAAMLEQQARAERAQFIEGDARAKPPSGARVPVDGVAEDYTSYNPTADHLVKADQLLRERSAHLAAAKQLLEFADQACAGLPAGERASCPLLASSVDRVQPERNGFTLLMRPSVDRNQTLKRLSCHLAYAEATGFDRPSCPLFIKGTTLKAVGDTGIAFTASADPVAAELRAQARRLFVGRPGTESE